MILNFVYFKRFKFLNRALENFGFISEAITSKSLEVKKSIAYSIVVSFFFPLSGLPPTPMYSILFKTLLEPCNISGSKPSAQVLITLLF